MEKMKNAIQYYYGLYPKDISKSNGSYFFEYQKAHYYLTPYNRSMEELLELQKISLQLFEKRVFCHQFILNHQQELITVINQIPYVLLCVFVKAEEPISIEYVLFFSNLTVNDGEKSPLKRNHWKSLWMEKNDYFEYQVNQFGKQFPKIRESFSYFIGLSEIGIALLNEVHIHPDLVISHRRIHPKDTLFDLYNPLNFVLDYKERDIIEYCKGAMLEEENMAPILENYIQIMNLQEGELKLLLARAFYPTFYFDRYEKIINQHVEESILDDVIVNQEKYEYFLSHLYTFLRTKIVLPDMPWLTKNIG